MNRFQMIGWLLVVSLAFGGGVIGCGDDDDDNDDNTADDDDDNDDNDNNDDDDVPALQVGAARVDITPDFPVIMAGYGSCFLSEAFCRWSEGVHDPLYASALAIDDGTHDPLIVIALDTIGIIVTDSDIIRQTLADELAVAKDGVTVSATHTHHGPDTIGIFGVMFPPQTGRDDEFIALMIDGAVEAGRQAYQNRRPAYAYVGDTQEDQLHFNHEQGIFAGAELDSTLTVLAFAEPDGTAIGSMMNWGCHATSKGPKNTQISADFPGAYYRHMDAEVGGVNLFVNGNLGGGVLPVNNPGTLLFGPSDWGTWEEVDFAGGRLAQDAQDALADADPLVDPQVETFGGVMRAKLMNPFFALINLLNLIPREMPGFGQYGETLVSGWRFGPVSFASIPGESDPTPGLDLRAFVGNDYQIIANITQDWIGYVLTAEQYRSLRYFYYSLFATGPGVADSLLETYEEIWPAE